MIKQNYKGRCEKIKLSKSKNACRTYNPIQLLFAKLLDMNPNISEIRSNVLMEGLGLDERYTSDFVCTKTDGDIMVRECVYRKLLSRPKTAKMLDASREYWLRHGIQDWGIVIDAEESIN